MSNDIDVILSGTETVIGLEELKKKLECKKKICIKLGADPTSPNLHLGHAVVLEKLKDFQKLGHRVIFLIGDFTAQIGDPTGKIKTRPPLTKDQIKVNVKTYVDQIAKILDISQLEIIYNSQWFDSFSSYDWIKLTSQVTIAQIIEREDFKKRFSSNLPIRFHELLYPLLQAYDSVELKADIEIGGTDQTFNLLLGRDLQESLNMQKQVVITMPLIEGLDGKQKMSKSLHNDIGLTEEPKIVFGKIMSISDELMYKYYRVLLRYDDSLIESMKKNFLEIENKKNLASIIIEKYWNIDEANKSRKYFTDTFQNKFYDNGSLKKIYLKSSSSYTIFDLFFLIEKDISRSDIRRLIHAGGISLNSIKITSEKYIFSKNDLNENMILKIGKHKLYSLEFE